MAELGQLGGLIGDDYIKLLVANIIKIEDKEKPLSEPTQVFPIVFECSALVLIFPSDIRHVCQFIKTRHCSSCTWNAPAE